MGTVIECRVGCGACCIAPSISSPLPGLPNGKPAGVRCLHLTDDDRCRLWGTTDYPKVCQRFQPQLWICGRDKEEALINISALERLTAPAKEAFQTKA